MIVDLDDDMKNWVNMNDELMEPIICLLDHIEILISEFICRKALSRLGPLKENLLLCSSLNVNCCLLLNITTL